MLRKISFILILGLSSNLLFSQDGLEDFINNDTLNFTLENQVGLERIISSIMSGILNETITVQDEEEKDVSKYFYKSLDKVCESLFSCNYIDIEILVISLDYEKLGELQIIGEKENLKIFSEGNLKANDSFIISEIPNLMIIRKTNNNVFRFIIIPNR